jgi:hypothetical protein
VARILEFIPPQNALDPRTITILGDAYEKTLRSLHHGGQPKIVRQVIAKRIIELATEGRARSRAAMQCRPLRDWHPRRVGRLGLATSVALQAAPALPIAEKSVLRRIPLKALLGNISSR